MKKIKLMVLHSFIMLPLISTGATLSSNPIGDLHSAIQEAVSIQENKEVPLSPEQLLDQEHAAKIDAFFSERGWPLSGNGEKFIEVSKENNLDPYLLAAIASRESSGGLDACNKHPSNVFGWNSCKVGFENIDDAIETVGAHLGGNNPKTEKYYKDKTSEEILNTYNPPRIVKNYTKEVLSIMKSIEDTNINTTVAVTEDAKSES